MQEPRVLYTSGSVRKEIRVLLRAPALDDRRVVVVAYIGKDVLSLLPLPDLSGLEIVCSPTPAGTSHKAIKALQKRGARVKVSDKLHAKVYWSKHRGCIITSANLSMHALGASGLTEIGVWLPPGVVDIDRVLKAAYPRSMTSADLSRLAKGEAHSTRVFGVPKGPSIQTTFLEWYKDQRGEPWKLAWGEEASTYRSRAATRVARDEYGKSEAAFWLNVAKGQVRQDEWVLVVYCTAKGLGTIEWMYADAVVKVDKADKGVYEAACPWQAVQVLPLAKCASPPFSLTPPFKVALKRVIADGGIGPFKARKDFTPSKTFLKKVHRMLSR